ncbi:ATP-binding cassette domain-containing protein [Candidatus Binatia bacterium]|nr:ATP-binding cassette domain-containing protein [Candidatus Binatia bacterium]
MTSPAPDEHVFSFDGLNWSRLRGAVRNFASSEVGDRAIVLFWLLIFFLVGINGLNVLNSYVGRDFMTAIQNRNARMFWYWTGVYVVVFAASTMVAVLYRFVEERLGLLWREWLTRQLVRTYVGNRTYFRLREQGTIDNPDQRIAEDVRTFTVTTLSFFLMLLNGTFTILAFSGVLWSISPTLFGVAVGYATLGSLATIALGRPLVRLNYNQFDKEASFRAELIHIRENAESVALLHRERRLTARLLRRVDGLVANLKRIIAVNRNLGFFTTGYSYLIQIIPTVLVAPLFIRGQVEFGVITQAAMAFAQLLGAFSLIVTQFQSISSYAAVLARLSDLVDAVEHTTWRDLSAIEIVEADGPIVYDRLTLRSPRDGRIVLKDLSASIPRGYRLFVTGPSDTGKVALFRATAGIWDWGSGRIVHPGLDAVVFLPERPYLPPGTMREVLVRTGKDSEISDALIEETLHLLGLDKLVVRAGGLDVERDWDNILGLGEQQLLAVARVLLAAPNFVFLQRPSTALDAAEVETVHGLLAERGIGYVTFGKPDDARNGHQARLTLSDDGAWEWTDLDRT